MHNMNDKPHYAIAEAAKRLGVHPDTLRRWHKAGIAKPLVLPGGNHRRFTQEEIDRLAALMRQDQENGE